MAGSFKKSSKKFFDITARDTIALGGIAIFIMAIARAAFSNYWDYIIQMLFAGLILFIFQLFIKSENHSARAIIIFTFTTLFYNRNIFTYFAIFLLILFYTSLFYLDYNKKQILIGTFLGIISSWISYIVI